MRYFKLLPQCRGDLCSSGVLHCMKWQFLTDINGQAIDPIFRDHKNLRFLSFLDPYRWDGQAVPKLR